METNQIEYKISSATETQIKLHLFECSENFIPSLDSTVNISEYAQKIYSKAITFEAFCENVLVGLIAAYFNHEKKNAAFITNVSTNKQFSGRGIASELMNNVIAYAITLKSPKIILEVNKNNNSANKLYQNFSFVQLSENEHFLTLELNLKIITR
jgi:ribosomal protein S18 acetylase RimI-like enzyme